MSVTLKTINNRISKIGNGETTLRSELGTVSRELLEYVPATGDIDAVNRLIAVLTPKNKEGVTRFFTAFLPYKYEGKENRFGKKSTNKDLVAKRKKLIEVFLEDDAHTVWTWLSEKKEAKPREQKPKEFAKEIEKAVTRAIERDDNPDRIDMLEVLRHTIKACMTSGHSMSEIMAEFNKAIEEETKASAELVKKEDVKQDHHKDDETNDIPPATEQVVARRKTA